ncbi:MAG: NAD(P)H-flavin reductase [Glaciecola sp.]
MITVQSKVVSIEPLTPYVLKLILDAQQAINFKPGQYLQVVMGEGDKRPFSIASMPSQDNLIELHIGATPDNSYAYEVVEKARQEQSLTVEIGLGNAFLRESERPLIVIAGGTGYSYAKSIVLSCLQQQPQRDIHLYWGAKNAEDLYEADDLSALATLHPHFIFIPVVENPNADWEGKTGMVHQAVMADFTSLSDTQVYTAGRFEMSAVIRDAFVPLGLDSNHLFGDAYAYI